MFGSSNLAAHLVLGIYKAFNLQILPSLFNLDPYLHHSVSLNMPWRRGISRRGGNRGGSSRPAPQNDLPIASVPPSSASMGSARPSLQNSYQTFNFTFHSRLNRPTLTASISIILTEEENNQVSVAQTTSSQSQEESVLYGDMTGVVFNENMMQENPTVPEEPQQPVNLI